MTSSGASKVRTKPREACCLCGRDGSVLYRELRDVRYGCPGVWKMRKCSNGDCNLLWLDPVPIEEDTPLIYSYFRETHHDSVEQKRFPSRFRGCLTPAYLSLKYSYPLPDDLPRVIKLLGMLAYLRPPQRTYADFPFAALSDVPKGRLLDIGCGGGATMLMMRNWGWRVEGVDFDPAAIDNARRKGLTVYLGSVTDQSFAESSFDLVIMSHVIEHVHDPVRFLGEALRVVRPGGKVLVATPNAWSFGHSLWKGSWVSLASPYHLSLFNPPLLAATMRTAGCVEARAWSGARWARESFMASLDIFRRGSLEGGIPQSRAFQFFGSFMAWMEWLGLKMKHNMGEEILAVGSK